MQRKQFTFYYSFFDTIRCIPTKAKRADAYDALCAYALLGQEPDLERLGPEVQMVMKMCMPILSAARERAMGGNKKRHYTAAEKAGAYGCHRRAGAGRTGGYPKDYEGVNFRFIELTLDKNGQLTIDN